jgi:transposase
MLMFRELPRVYLHRAPVDFRKSINGLAVIVEQQLSLRPPTAVCLCFVIKAVIY